MPETLNEIKEDVAAIKAETEAPRRRRGRPPGSKNATSRAKTAAAEKFDMPPPETLAPMIDAIFAMVATRAGEHWKLTSSESTELARLTHLVVMKYGATLAEKYGPEIMLGGYLTVVIASRVWTSYQLKQAEKQSTMYPAPVPSIPEA